MMMMHRHNHPSVHRQNGSNNPQQPRWNDEDSRQQHYSLFLKRADVNQDTNMLD
jgi:hypothetical protein